MAKFMLTRDVSIDECPWLETLEIGPLKAGTVVYHFWGPTYGAVDQFPASFKQGETPFFELPYNSIVRI